jgi:hypothetical protein
MSSIVCTTGRALWVGSEIRVVFIGGDRQKWFFFITAPKSQAVAVPRGWVRTNPGAHGQKLHVLMAEELHRFSVGALQFSAEAVLCADARRKDPRKILLRVEGAHGLSLHLEAAPTRKHAASNAGAALGAH